MLLRGRLGAFGRAERRTAVDGTTLWLALGLFTVSLALASRLRRRDTPARARGGTTADEGTPPG